MSDTSIILPWSVISSVGFFLVDMSDTSIYRLLIMFGHVMSCALVWAVGGPKP